MSFGHYGEGRQQQSKFVTETRHFNGVLYATGQKVIVSCEIFEKSSSGRSLCWAGKREKTEGVIIAFEANHRSRPVIRYTVPSGATKGKVVTKLHDYYEVSLPEQS